ncbi:MAG: carbon-nitrogen hydrolase [Candidatus Bathyarchaeia archaeon]|jgi:agmatine deiminase
MVTVSSASDTKDQRKIVNVGLIQTALSADITDNIRRTVDKVEEASRMGAQIICLPELYRTWYFPQEEKIDVGNLAETVPGETTKTFSTLAKKNGTVIIAPIFEKAPNGKHYNSAVVIDADGKTSGVYRKMHVPFDPLFYEKNFFEAGDNGYCVFETRYARVGVLICYDQWFPEPARINALKGAEIIFYPTAIGYVEGDDQSDGDWHDAWKTVQRGHAIANGIHVAAVNRVGVEGQLNFWGGSFLCDSFGMMLKEASFTKEETLVVKVDLTKNRRIQDGWGFLRNRRPETYQKLVEDTEK